MMIIEGSVSERFLDDIDPYFTVLDHGTSYRCHFSQSMRPVVGIVLGRASHVKLDVTGRGGAYRLQEIIDFQDLSEPEPDDDDEMPRSARVG